MMKFRCCKMYLEKKSFNNVIVIKKKEPEMRYFNKA